MRPEAVLFDLDGTLADSAPDLARCVNVMLERRGRPPVALAVVRPHVSKGARGMIGAAFGYGTDHPEFAAMREEFLAIYEENLSVETALFPGVPELLAALEAEAIAWGVVTNKFERFARSVLQALGIAERSRVIVGGDTCGKAKPHAEPLLHACATIGAAPARSIYVGDDERDVQAARAAGMKVLVAAYGYLGDRADEMPWGADAAVDSPVAIGRWIGLARVQGS